MPLFKMVIYAVVCCICCISLPHVNGQSLKLLSDIKPGCEVKKRFRTAALRHRWITIPCGIGAKIETLLNKEKMRG